MAGREETTEGPPDELYVEINEGTTSVPEDWEVEPGVLELEDAGDCVEVEVEERGTDVAAMFEFPPLESRREDSNGGSDSARALEIACANALVSCRETGWLGGEAGVLTVGAGVEPLEEGEDAVTGEDIVDKLLFVVRILNERDDPHALKSKWKKKGYNKSTL